MKMTKLREPQGNGQLRMTRYVHSSAPEGFLCPRAWGQWGTWGWALGPQSCPYTSIVSEQRPCGMWPSSVYSLPWLVSRVSAPAVLIPGWGPGAGMSQGCSCL